MKYITEDDLRTQYRSLPFDTFTVESSFRLTPGARMFLTDRKINIMDENDPEQSAKFSAQQVRKEKTCRVPMQRFSAEQTSNLDFLELRCELLRAASDLAMIDLTLAQNLCNLEQYLGAISRDKSAILPTLIQLGKNEKQVDKSVLEERLSSVAQVLQEPEGAILTRLYPIYFHCEAYGKILAQEEATKVKQITNLLGLLIVHYLGGGDTGKKTDC